ncbi:carboxypeptidase-like regulatory domain-containing protein [Rhodoferax sediminis]|jgi:hypothetical protein|uniref:Carboxypeptidase regulatory-like domain-containing protein n=1 Tax=Rhodoferax sediminis TaxID=2509614 RepID=A0A515DG94_9BURK|nr:carboxypeptidase-like regulatory domain-containing protein [Rhodoferax sediminis]QDL39424.1 carboxypeptidase regulatory-like domain-containing protein [Rhodoferax sediminis]
MKASIRQAAAVAALGAALFGMASAQAGVVPPMQKIDGIEIMSGGIGDGEAAAIQSEARHWPLTLEFAIKNKARSNYAADVNVIVRDAKGHTVLQTTSDGPFLLARLNPGQYTVQASLDGKTLQQKVMVGHQPARRLFLWPAGTDESAS